MPAKNSAKVLVDGRGRGLVSVGDLIASVVIFDFLDDGHLGNSIHPNTSFQGSIGKKMGAGGSRRTERVVPVGGGPEMLRLLARSSPASVAVSKRS